MADTDPTKRQQADENDSQRRRWRVLIVALGIVAAMLLWLLLGQFIPKSAG